MINTPENINIFIAYAREDKAYLEELRVQLSILERIKLVDKIWYDGMIQAGTNWENEIQNALENSDIILLLVSADFIASDFCYEKEMQRAIALHESKKVHTIPIILRPCLWKRTPLAALQALPEGEFPIASKHWKDKDEPYKQVVESIEEIILEMKASQRQETAKPDQSSFTQWIEEAEALMQKGEWNKAQSQLREALHLHEHGYQPSLVVINQQIERCQEEAENEMYYQQNLTQGKKAYETGDYQTAFNFFVQALHFRPAASEALKLKEACEISLGSREDKDTAPERTAAVTVEKQTKPDRTKIFQIKIFGMEIFKMIVALCAVGLVGTIAVRVFFQQEQMLQAARYNEERGIVEIVNAAKTKDGTTTEAGMVVTEFVEARDFSGGLLAVKNAQGEWGYISIKDGTVMEEIDFKYEGAWPHSQEEQLAYVKRNGKCGFIDLKGEEVIPLQYLDAAPFKEGLAMVKKGKQDYAFINAKGKEVISALDSVITPQFTNGEAWVVRQQKRILINREGKCLNGCGNERAANANTDKRRKEFLGLMKKAEIYTQTERYERALIVLQDAEPLANTEAEKLKVGNAIDAVGRQIKAQRRAQIARLKKQAEDYFEIGDYRSAASFYRRAIELESLPVLVEQLKRCELYLEKEKNITTPIYAFEHPSQKLGIKSKGGEVLLAPQFEKTLAYQHGMLAVQKDSKWGYVDQKGNIAIPIDYDKVSSFNQEGKANVIYKGDRMTINRTGKCLDCNQERGRNADYYTKLFLKRGEELRLDALDRIAKESGTFVNRTSYIKSCNFGLDLLAKKKCESLKKDLQGFGKIPSAKVFNASIEKYKLICKKAVQDYMRRRGQKYDIKLLDKILGKQRKIRIN